MSDIEKMLPPNGWEFATPLVTGPDEYCIAGVLKDSSGERRFCSWAPDGTCEFVVNVYGNHYEEENYSLRPPEPEYEYEYRGVAKWYTEASNDPDVKMWGVFRQEHMEFCGLQRRIVGTEEWEMMDESS